MNLLLEYFVCRSKGLDGICDISTRGGWPFSWSRFVDDIPFHSEKVAGWWRKSHGECLSVLRVETYHDC